MALGHDSGWGKGESGVGRCGVRFPASPWAEAAGRSGSTRAGGGAGYSGGGVRELGEGRHGVVKLAVELRGAPRPSK